jgi:hypothetical protein
MATTWCEVSLQVGKEQEEVMGFLTEGTTRQRKTGDGPTTMDQNDDECSSRTTGLESGEARWSEAKCHGEQQQGIGLLI